MSDYSEFGQEITILRDKSRKPKEYLIQFFIQLRKFQIAFKSSVQQRRDPVIFLKKQKQAIKVGAIF